MPEPPTSHGPDYTHGDCQITVWRIRVIDINLKHICGSYDLTRFRQRQPVPPQGKLDARPLRSSLLADYRINCGLKREAILKYMAGVSGPPNIHVSKYKNCKESEDNNLQPDTASIDS